MKNSFFLHVACSDETFKVLTASSQCLYDAAPMLYAALANLLEQCADSSDASSDVLMRPTISAIKDARAALARAKGE